MEQSVLGAVVELLTEKGIEGTTMSAVIERSGVARATVYLRWPNRQALVAAAIRRTMGPPMMISTGSVETDLRRAADRLGEVFSSPSFRAVFPAVVSGLTLAGPSNDGAEAQIRFEAVAPARAILIRTYRELAGSQGLREDVPAALVVDSLIGAHIGHYLATGKPPTAVERDLIVEILLDGLRRRSVG